MPSQNARLGLLVRGDEERRSAEELLQLLKVPIFLYSEEDYYACVVSNDLPPAQNFASLIISSRAREREPAVGLFSFQGHELPVPLPNKMDPVEENSVDGKPTLSFNFDLFRYLRLLFAGSQARAYSKFPTVDIIIDIMRDFLRKHIILVEVPPNPWDHSYCVALTHDVDHSSLSEHLGDPWYWTYLYRCSLYALYEYAKKKRSMERLGGALVGFLKGLALPAGLATDPWHLFREYIELEEKHSARSAFFFVPYSNDSGEDLGGKKARWDRAVSYDLEELREVFERIRSSGWELGSHWLNAWKDATEAKKEKTRVQGLTGGNSCFGGRVHWLFRDRNTLSILDKVGCCYDSSVGFPDVPGFASGTLCPYKPLECDRLIEIPLNIQDGVLLGKDRMHLSEEDALSEIEHVISLAEEHGGTIGLLWHLSSLGPPFLWDGLYERILNIFQEEGAWMETPQKMAQWQNARRNITFRLGTSRSEELVIVRSEEVPSKPFRVRIHGKPSLLLNRKSFEIRSDRGHFDVKFEGGEIELILRRDDERS